MRVQIKDFRSFGNFRTHFKKKDLLFLEPFKKNYRWEEKTVEATIKNEMGWSKDSRSTSGWRGDCDVAILKLYVYYEIFGWNDKVFNLSNLLRDGQMDRNEALERLARDEQVSDDIVKKFLDEIGVNFSDFKNAVGKAKELYSKGIIR